LVIFQCINWEAFLFKGLCFASSIFCFHRLSYKKMILFKIFGFKAVFLHHFLSWLKVWIFVGGICYHCWVLFTNLKPTHFKKYSVVFFYVALCSKWHNTCNINWIWNLILKIDI
jgi:hypothetical protein